MYKANDKYNAVLTQGYTVDDTIFYVNIVPTNIPSIMVLAKGTADEAVFTITNKTTSTLTGVAWLKGVSKNYLPGTSVTCLNNEEFVNQYAASVATPDALSPILYGADGGSTDAYSISLIPAPTSYAAITGVPITFKANTANTAGCTLNLNSLGAKTIVKGISDALATGDIVQNQFVTVIYDGTNFVFVSVIPQFQKISIASYTTNTGTALNVGTYPLTNFIVTAQAGALKFNNPGGSPVNGNKIVIRIKDNGTSRNLTYDTYFRGSSDLALPAATTLGKTKYMGFVYNETDTKWDMLATLDNFT